MATAAPELESKSLPANAYQPLKEGELYVPLVPTSMSPPEVTWRAVLWGTLLCVIFSVASAYSALKVGQGMEAAIPISILAIGLARMYRRRSTVLENMIITGMGGASGSVVAGAVFTVPALYILHLDPHPVQTIFICLAGGCLGILFLIPLRRYFVREMHGKFPFPEATAITEVLVTGEKGGSQAKLLIQATMHRRHLRLLRHHLPCLEGVPELPIRAGHAIAGRSPSHGLQLRCHRLHSRPRLRYGPAHLHDLLRRWRAGQLCAGPGDLVHRQPHGRRHGLSRHDSHFAHDGYRNLPQLCALHRRGRHCCRRSRRHPQIAARGGGIVRHRAARLPPWRSPAYGADRPRYSDHGHTPRRGGVGHRCCRFLWTTACHLDRGSAGLGADAALRLLLHHGGRQRHCHHGEQSSLRHDPAYRDRLGGGAAEVRPLRNHRHVLRDGPRRHGLRRPLRLGTIHYRPQGRLLDRFNALGARRR